MRAVKYRVLEQELRRNGCEFIRQKGSHQIWGLNGKTAPVPYGTEVTAGTLRDIIKHLGLQGKLSI